MRASEGGREEDESERARVGGRGGERWRGGREVEREEEEEDEEDETEEEAASLVPQLFPGAVVVKCLRR